MAAPLPAIHNSHGHAPIHGQAMMQHRVPSPPNKLKPQDAYRKPALKVKKRDRDAQTKQQALWQKQQPNLSSMEVQKYRNTYKHNLCLEMLKDGFHHSFSELFALIRQQKERLQSANNDVGFSATLLEDQEEKLNQLKLHLTEAESALRINDLEVVYNARNKLAEYFLSTDDLWLSDHFFASCLDTSLNIPGDGRRKGEAYCNMGLAFERRRDYGKATKYFEEFYNLASKNNWMTGDGLSLHSSACEHLRRVYTAVAEAHQKGDDKSPEDAIKYFQQAFDMAKESGDEAKEGDASYRLGLAYEDISDSETALMYHNGFMDVCKKQGDQVGMGKACQAIAKSYENQGKLEDAIRYLEMFVDIAERSKQDGAQAEACSCLGNIFNSLGEYDRASQYFGKAFNIARSMSDNVATASTRVLFGISSAHRALQAFAICVDRPSRTLKERLLNWKDIRSDQFDEVLQEQNAESENT
ncbi:tetratricopeptide repeat protein 29-like isoform X2 [Anneissia japonica]|nr:tetratricopeptide repeat protein 29-like isoform X2 [Anneissia japonica]XP_033098320.1 tetratricopeptide repeat protein 29-like isoform X2 [Anneissia japonica]XP_033098321.1 tetratricopeptide repeat protein 29-like isoform X2 [Anneissia japonica]XP_033098322.1 tetratricopeptide repeat protein 29-like isoform X2 [Anneissia japonica]